MTNQFPFVTIFDKSYEELKQMRLCINCSCGKDSVAVCIFCYERGIPIHSIIRYDNGDDWDCMETVWEQLKYLYQGTDTVFVKLKGTPLLDLINERHYYKVGEHTCFGYIPCGPLNRFGTDDKQKVLNDYIYSNGCTSVIGIAKDEDRKLFESVSYPLIELGYDEGACLLLCYKNGFEWREMTDFGFTVRLYDYCSRLSCIHCGFCNSNQLAMIIALFPSKFETFNDIQKRLDVPFKYWSSTFNMPLRLRELAH